MMKAFRYATYGGPEVVRLEDAPDPPFGADDVLIRVAATGVNPADWRLRNGQFKRFMKLSLPFIPGSDVAGIIERTGASVRSFVPGDEVYAMTPLASGGGCAEQVAIPAKLVARVPRRIHLIDAATVPLAGLTALQGLRKAGLRPKQSLLVVGGSGGVGHFVIQIGKALGARVTALCGARSFDFARGLGADDVIDYAMPEPLAGKRFDIVFDTMAIRPFTYWRKGLARGGVLLTVHPVIEKMVPGLLSRLLGVPRLRSIFVEPSGVDLAELATMISSGQVTPAVEARFAFRQAVDAYRLSENGHVRGKLVIQVRDDP